MSSDTVETKEPEKEQVSSEQSISPIEDFWKNLEMRSDDYWGVFFDITREDVVKASRNFGMEHLSPGTFPSKPFPADGVLCSKYRRQLIPLVCQKSGEKDSKAVVVWFVIITSTPYTYLTREALEALVGQESAAQPLHKLAIQDQESIFECRVSKHDFEHVNILGRNVFHKFGLAIETDWKNDTCQLVIAPEPESPDSSF